MRLPSRLLSFGLIALVTGCQLDAAPEADLGQDERAWTLAGLPSLVSVPWLRPRHVTLDVAAGHIFAGDFHGNEFTYWIIDPATGIIENQTIVVNPGTRRRRGSVKVRAHQAAGIYITTPDYTHKPTYPITFRGDVEDGGVFSYLDTDTDGFNGLRVLDPVDMVATHNTMVAGAASMLATFEDDLDDIKANAATATFQQIQAAEGHLQPGVELLTDSPDIYSTDTANPALWIQDLIGLEGAIDANAMADVAVADGNALVLESSVPNAAEIQQAVEHCIDAFGVADEIESVVTQLFPDQVNQEDWDYDGRRATPTGWEDGPITDSHHQRAEDELSAYLDGLDEISLSYEDCVLHAVGGEPTVSYDDILPDPYEAIGLQAETTAASVEIDVEQLELDLTAAYAEEIVHPAGVYDPALWGAAEDHALSVLHTLVGPDMLADPPPPTGPVGPVTMGGGTVSSPNACADVTPVFQINIGNFGLAIGTPFDDVIRGADNASGFEILIGGKGDDCINARAGHELIFGNDGHDEIHGGDQHEIVFGNAGEDTIFAGNGEDYNILLPTTPPTTLTLEIGSLVFGGPDDDDISGADPTYDDTDGNTFGYTDFLFGDGITGSNDNDEIDGGAGIDFLFGQGGNDDIANRRPGRIQWSTPATSTTPAVSKNIRFGSFHFGGDGVDQHDGCDSTDLMFGNSDPDTMRGAGGLDLMFSGPGNDPLVDGQDGVDFVFGGAGDDTVRGGNGIDLVMGNLDRDTVFGDNGVFDLLFGNDANDIINGGGGVDMAFGGPGQDHVNGDASFDILFGGADNDTVRGGDGPDLAFGSQGRDLMEGGASIDLMFGGAETDILRGNDGIDILFGNDDNDWISGDDGIDFVWANDGFDAVYGGANLDVLFGGNDSDCMWGEAGIDLAFGGDAVDFISGGPDLDLVVGGEGDDILRGDNGVDFMLGGNGEDHLSGGNGVDLLFGGDAHDDLLGEGDADFLFGGSGEDCAEGAAGFNIGFGGDDNDLVRGTSVAFGGSGRDEMTVGLAGFGGSEDDTMGSATTGVVLMLGNDGNDDLYIAPNAGLALAFGNGDNDVITAPGATPTSTSNPVRTFMFGNDGEDWMQASRGKSRAFGNRGDDIMSADADGTNSNNDERDWVFGNQDSDALYGDGNSRRDLLLRGSGSDPSRTRDGWPSTSPSWTAAHAAPTFGTCDAAPQAQFCEEVKDQPQDVGAPE